MSPDATPQQWIGKAIAYHMATVPMLAFKPGRDDPQEHRGAALPALEKMPLLGLAAPGLAVTLAVSLVFQVIVA